MRRLLDDREAFVETNACATRIGLRGPHPCFALGCRRLSLMVVQRRVTQKHLRRISPLVNRCGWSTSAIHLSCVRPAIWFGRACLGQAVLNAQSFAQPVKFMVVRHGALRAGQQPMAERFAMVSRNLRVLIGQALSKALGNERAAAAVLALWT